MAASNTLDQTRREFIGHSAFAALGTGAALLPAGGQKQDRASTAIPEAPTHFFADPSFDFIFQAALGQTYYRGANPGKLLHIASQVKSGDSEGAYKAFRKAGAEAEQTARASASRRHRVSA